MRHPTGDLHEDPPVVTALRAGLQLVREAMTRPEPTGMRWRRPEREEPDWCRKDHGCTAAAGYPSGEHRSRTALWTPPYGRLHVTRVQRVDGLDHVDMGISVRLNPDVRVAMSQFTYVPVAADLAIRSVLAELELLTPALEPAHRRLEQRR